MITLIIVLVIVGFLMWLLNTMIPMDSRVKMVINALILIAAFFYVLQVFCVCHGGPSLK